MTSFEHSVGQWRKRRTNLGDEAVGRKDERAFDQAARIDRLLVEWLADDKHYEHGLDFGCGWGRFVDRLADSCKHLWVVDVFEDWVQRAALMAPNTTAICLYKPKLPLYDDSMDLVVDLLTLQSLPDDLYMKYLDELRRVAVTGATVISLHAQKPGTRSAEKRAELLDLEPDYRVIETTDIDEVDDPYNFLVGVKA